jgi:phosphatidate cytidylyltransferase
MLRLRLLTAAVLLLIIAVAVGVPSAWPMLVLLAVMCGCALWEWLRLVCPDLPWARVAGVLAALVLAWLSSRLVQGDATVAHLFEWAILPLAVAFWWLLAPVVVLRARLPAACHPLVLALTGVLLLSAAWYGLAWIFLRHGAVALISLWALVWCADSAAYFTGRSLGRHKLAPRVSPGKTWEGAVGGVLAAVLWLAGSALWWPGSYGALLLERLSWPGLIVAGAVLAAWSIIGDLFESLLKRHAGVKDSSQLLPGHGGVYDRIDAVLPVVPAAILLLVC